MKAQPDGKYNVTFSIEPETLYEVQQIAIKLGVARSEALRILVDTGLEYRRNGGKLKRDSSHSYKS